MLAAMASTHPGVYEYELDAAARYVYLVNGARLEGYRSIIGAGTQNIANMHYYRNMARADAGQMILMDYAPEYHYYTSDIGRMWPVDGKFQPAQRVIAIFAGNEGERAQDMGELLLVQAVQLRHPGIQGRPPHAVVAPAEGARYKLCDAARACRRSISWRRAISARESSQRSAKGNANFAASAYTMKTMNAAPKSLGSEISTPLFPIA